MTSTGTMTADENASVAIDLIDEFLDENEDTFADDTFHIRVLSAHQGRILAVRELLQQGHLGDRFELLDSTVARAMSALDDARAEVDDELEDDE